MKSYRRQAGVASGQIGRWLRMGRGPGARSSGLRGGAPDLGGGPLADVATWQRVEVAHGSKELDPDCAIGSRARRTNAGASSEPTPLEGAAQTPDLSRLVTPPRPERRRGPGRPTCGDCRAGPGSGAGFHRPGTQGPVAQAGA